MKTENFLQSQNTKRIWLDDKVEKDSYAEFVASFDSVEGETVSLKITADSCYAVWVNEQLAAFSTCGDYPWYKLYDCIDITSHCQAQNKLRIQVWYFGEDSQIYYKGNPGVAFEVLQGEKILLYSNQNTLSAKITNYRNGQCKVITKQLGYSFCYDNSFARKPIYQKSAELPMWKKLVLRKTEPLVLHPRVSASLQKLPDGYLIDLGEEVVGFLELDIHSSVKQSILISYGEHLADALVPRIIGERDFSVEIIVGKGLNHYMNPFRRLAGRYLQITCREPLTIHYCGIRPVELPVIEKKVEFDDKLDQKIYDVSVNTLKKCMHEHYEDCPWREQAMYTMDSRNQMLCGYEAFEGTTYQREMLLLMAQGQRTDGLLSLCFPAGLDSPIPFFSLVYLKILEEYVAYTSDKSVLELVQPNVSRLMEAFESRIEKNGLIANFPYPYWNFYEWADESNNEDEITTPRENNYQKQYDIILNAMYVHAVEIYNRLYNQKKDVEQTRTAIKRTFYDAEKRIYCLSTKGKNYSVLGNSMALLIGLEDEKLAQRIISDRSLIPVTLSMTTFFYDSLLLFGDRFHEEILADIHKKYLPMLEEGATTFWETADGWQDFDGAGSLCHGWSALPVYYLKKLMQ